MCYFCEINVVSKLVFVFGFKVEFFDFVFVDYYDVGFFCVGGIDEYFFSYVFCVYPGLCKFVSGFISGGVECFMGCFVMVMGFVLCSILLRGLCVVFVWDFIFVVCFIVVFF